MISIYTSAKVLDGILYGLDTGKVLLVISERHREIADRVMKQLERGVTFLQGAGAWSGEEKQILLCAVRANQCFRVEEIVRSLDPDAFVIILEAELFVHGPHSLPMLFSHYSSPGDFCQPGDKKGEVAKPCSFFC